MKSRLLTQLEVDALPDGTRVKVIWSGGNGPHEYRIVRGKHGESRVDNIYQDRLEQVGQQPLTQVWLVDEVPSREQLRELGS